MSQIELIIIACAIWIVVFAISNIAFFVVVLRHNERQAETIRMLIRSTHIQHTGRDFQMEKSDAKHVSLAEKQKKAMDAQRRL